MACILILYGRMSKKSLIAPKFTRKHTKNLIFLKQMGVSKKTCMYNPENAPNTGVTASFLHIRPAKLLLRYVDFIPKNVYTVTNVRYRTKDPAPCGCRRKGEFESWKERISGQPMMKHS